MCITRVARILSVDSNNLAKARFLDDDAINEIDVSMVKVGKNSYVEVFADSALRRLSGKEARWRKSLWLLLRQIRKEANARNEPRLRLMVPRHALVRNRRPSGRNCVRK